MLYAAHKIRYYTFIESKVIETFLRLKRQGFFMSKIRYFTWHTIPGICLSCCNALLQSTL